MKRPLPHTLALSILLSFGLPTAIAAGPVSGIETQHIDHQVRIQDDFFRHLNGKWLANTEIPADRSSWGAFNKLIDDTQPHLKALIEAAAKNPGASSDNQKIGDFYNSFMDEAKLEQLGLSPLSEELARIQKISSKQQLAAQIGHLTEIGAAAPLFFSVHQDAKDATQYVADLGQSGLGMPDREYYLKQDDKRLQETRAKYWQHIARMFELAGHKNSAQIADQILALETELARAQWSRVELRDPVKAYNKYPIGKLAALAPGFDWPGYLKQTGLAGKTNYLIISQPSYVKGMAKALQQQPLESWKHYLQWQILRAYAPNLSSAFVKESFAFNSTTLSGATEDRPRWKRAVSLVEGSLGESVGKLYVAQHFPLERKTKMEALVKNLLLAYQKSIDTLDWMSPATKKQAQDKLAKFTPKIGFPNRWRDYSSLNIKGDDLAGNVMRTAQYNHRREVNKLGKPVDRDEWFISPQTVNAYYNPELNEIVFPAAILQPPFFDANADDAVNYGAIGAVIGHEISHGFDDQGSQYDGDGNLRNWWTAQDLSNFRAKTRVLIDQYNGYSPLPGYQINGELTLGENIADNSGLVIAWKAYQLSLGGKPAAEIDGLSGSQRFFMGFGQVWRAKMRDPAMIARIKTDPHSPAEFRSNGTLRNHPGFYEAFKVKEGDKMYLPPEKRVNIW